MPITDVNSGTIWTYQLNDQTLIFEDRKYYSIIVGQRPLILRERTVITESNDFYVALYEDEGSTGGTEIDSIINRNRKNPKNRTFTGFVQVTPDNPNLDPVTDAISYVPIKSSSLLVAGGVFSQTNQGEFWILKPNSEYLVEIFQGENASRIFQYFLNMEEVFEEVSVFGSPISSKDHKTKDGSPAITGN